MSPRRCRSSGMWPSPASSECFAFSPVTSTPPMTTRPALDLAQPGDRVDELALAVAVDAGDADDLARAHVEGDAADGLEPALVAHLQVLDAEDRVARLRRRPLVDAQQHLAPDHERREAVLGRALARHGLDRLAAPQNRDPVGDVEHLVELVRDEDDRLALGLERAQDREQLVRLLRRQHGRGLVEDEDVGAAVERLQDLHALLLADRDRLDLRVGLHGEAEALRDVAHPLARLVHVHERAPVRLDAEDDVLRHRHHRDEHEVLVHHPDPEVDRLVRGADPLRLPAHADLALVGVVEPVEDVHQRRLAGAVLAEERVHLAGPELEVDRVVGDDAREPLRDALAAREEARPPWGGERNGAGDAARPVNRVCPT